MRNKLDEILLSENVRDNFHSSYNGEFKVWLDSLLPEIEKCASQKQDNPWHVYNCLDHILYSVEEMNKQTKKLPIDERRKLAYAMFFHDIGKPDSYIRRYSKAYGRYVDSFFNHNVKSREIASRVLDKLGFNVKEQKELLLLVEEHDIFMFITLKEDGNPHHRALNNELIKEYIAKFNSVGDGEKLMNELIMVGCADNKSQNPKMTAESLKLLGEFSSRLQEISQNSK